MCSCMLRRPSYMELAMALRKSGSLVQRIDYIVVKLCRTAINVK